ncbi:MAG: cytochrome C oxidase subunit IV family protein [bacterium]|jgi:cytochrome c oxidase subunit 4
MNEHKTTGAAHDAGALHVHVVPASLFILIFVALMFLTIVTVAVTYVDLGALNLWVAMIIATLKGLLVALFFMHLRWDRLFNGFVFMSALVFVSLFIGIALMDTASYKPTQIPGYAPAMERRGGGEH